MYTAKGAKGKLSEGKPNEQKPSPITSSKKQQIKYKNTYLRF